MSDPELWYGYIDESGSVSLYSGSRYFIVAALLASNPRAIELHVKRARSRLGRKARADEMKASATAQRIVVRLVEAMAVEEIEVAAAILDKRTVLRPPGHPEVIYYALLQQVVRDCVSRHPRLELSLDRRYTSEGLRSRLERRLRDDMADLRGQAVVVRQDDSRANLGLQAADHVCWAFYRKYEHADAALSELLRHVIVSEELVERHLW